MRGHGVAQSSCADCVNLSACTPRPPHEIIRVLARASRQVQAVARSRPAAAQVGVPASSVVGPLRPAVRAVQAEGPHAPSGVEA